MNLIIDPALKRSFPAIEVKKAEIKGIEVKKKSDSLEKLKMKIIDEVKKEYALEDLKDTPLIRSYRDFYWRIGIDPTKIRPSSEALIRRILQGKDIPNINTCVDAYNLVSIKANVSIGVFDMDKMLGDLILRSADEGEKFIGIGMDELKQLKGNEIVVADDEKIIAIYPYRDSDETKVTLKTKNIVILICGVPGIRTNILKEAMDLTIEYITCFCKT
jgi:DNA/RNA-binding domain of Phe-tRNA-synthetase-like protein